MTILEKTEELKLAREFTMRSCWECNSGHGHLKSQSGLFKCFGCNQWFINGDYLNNEEHRNSIYTEK